MYVIRLPVELHKIGLEVSADYAEHAVQAPDGIRIKHFAPIARNEHNVRMQVGHDVPASP